MTVWDDLNARARGLATHLLGRPALEAMARAADLREVATLLSHRGYLIDEAACSSGAALELAARRALAARMRTLIRWAGPRRELLSVLFDDEDRRSIAAMLRGAAQRAPADLRLSGLIPTPELPERALAELARQPSVAAVAALLSAWRHPLAPALLPAAARPEPDLLQLEHGLSAAFVRRALRSARRAGRHGLLQRHVRQVVDIENAFTVLMLAEEEKPRIGELWLDGGQALTLDLGRRAAGTGDLAAAAALVALAFKGSHVARAFTESATAPAGLEAAVLRAQIADLRTLTRLEPLSVAPLLAFALRLRAEACDVRQIIWGVSLGAPAATLADRLVTVT